MRLFRQTEKNETKVARENLATCFRRLQVGTIVVGSSAYGWVPS